MIETSTSPLDRLYRLQEILLDIQRKTEKKNKVPDHLSHVEAAYRDSVKRRGEMKDRIEKAQARKKTLEEEVADLAEKLKKYQGQLPMVKTNREYGAILDEMDGVKREVRTREDELLALDETLEKAKTEGDDLGRSFPTDQAAYEEQMTDWRAEQALLQEQIQKAQTDADALRATLDKRLLGSFDRIAKVRAGVAVAKVVMVSTHNAACSACNVRIRPQLLSDIRLTKEMITCDNCKRILYWVE